MLVSGPMVRASKGSVIPARQAQVRYYGPDRLCTAVNTGRCRQSHERCFGVQRAMGLRESLTWRDSPDP